MVCPFVKQIILMEGSSLVAEPGRLKLNPVIQISAISVRTGEIDVTRNCSKEDRKGV